MHYCYSALTFLCVCVDGALAYLVMEMQYVRNNATHLYVVTKVPWISAKPAGPGYQQLVGRKAKHHQCNGNLIAQCRCNRVGRAAGTLYRACQRPTRSEKAAAFFPGKRGEKR